MKRLSIVALLLLFFACNNSTKPIQDNFNLADFKKEKIEFINGEMLVPNEYQKMTLEDYWNVLIPKYDSTQLTLAESILRRLEGLEQVTKFHDVQLMFFVDSQQPENNILIQSNDYMNFDKSIGNQYLGMVDEQQKQDAAMLGIGYERLENKFYQTGISKVIKIKIKNTYPQHSVYITQYLVTLTQRKQTFAVTFMQFKDLDTDAIIGKLSVN